MPATTAEIVKTPGEQMPFKVVFSRNGQIVAERPVASSDGGRQLIDTLLPLLQKHEDI